MKYNDSTRQDMDNNSNNNTSNTKHIHTNATWSNRIHEHNGTNARAKHNIPKRIPRTTIQPTAFNTSESTNRSNVGIYAILLRRQHITTNVTKLQVE